MGAASKKPQGIQDRSAPATLLGGSSQSGSKWLITMVSCCPLNVDIPLINGLNGLYMEVTNYLLSGMILQVWKYGGTVEIQVIPKTHAFETGALPETDWKMTCPLF